MDQLRDCERRINDGDIPGAITVALEALSSDSSPVTYCDFYDLLSPATDRMEIEAPKRLKIAILSTYTFDAMAGYLYFECVRIGLLPKFYIAGFGQYVQEIIGQTSGLYQFQPDLLIIAAHAEAMLGPVLESPFRIEVPKKQKIVEESAQKFSDLIDHFCRQSSGSALVHNLMTPAISPYGILENKIEGSPGDCVRLYNKIVSSRLSDNSQVHILDFDSWAGYFGKSRVRNPKMWYMAKIYLADDFMAFLARVYMRYIKPLKSLNKKCLVLDLDNTLWGGILGEDGAHGIDLDTGPPGNAYRDFQFFIKSLKDRGLILAINSRNNFEEAMSVIRTHPYMILKEDDFSSVKINWNDKVKNLEQISNELNIGLDSMIYLDDNPAERLLVRQFLPEILTVDLPHDASLYRVTLEEMTDWDSLALTEEDRRRPQLYLSERRRDDLKRSSGSMEKFLASLEMEVEIKPADDFSLPRLAQLTQRTNQFNLTTRRYNEKQLEQMRRSPLYRLYAVGAKDRFGDNGLIGAAIVFKQGAAWRIDTFLLSCRVIGRQIETVMLAKIARDARVGGATCLEGEYLPTAKNNQVQNFYAGLGFKQNPDGLWIGDISRLQTAYPAFIGVHEE
ncbi:MAG: HAD-IIIC family phosphatase [Elusimicrobia bacterium]|nr:HAD-IIIC family phosphatase [Elusimicrobiota bacterium]